MLGRRHVAGAGLLRPARTEEGLPRRSCLLPDGFGIFELPRVFRGSTVKVHYLSLDTVHALTKSSVLIKIHSCSHL